MSTSNEDTISFTVNGQTYQTWYRVYGDLSTRTRTPLVALHGGPGLVSDYLVPLQSLATSYDIPVIIYDQIGNGRSSHIRDKADSPTFWSLDLFLDELSNLLLHLGIQNEFDLWGHSWGGILSLEYAIRQKSKGLKHLILSDSLPSVELWGQSSMQLLKEFPEDVQEGMMKGMSNPTKYLDALKKFHAVHGCTVVPMPEEVVRTLEGVFGQDGDPTVALALYVFASSPPRMWPLIRALCTRRTQNATELVVLHLVSNRSSSPDRYSYPRHQRRERHFAGFRR